MLLASAPFLLFPILHIEATFLALILTAVIWLLPLIIRPYPWPSPSPVDLLLLLWGCVLIIS
ncbi:MAG: hypothetical protein GY796_30235, partial [Chloroflexi bacterium]|nr:hypothetical protein [Chloroflexota bacterium]